MDLGGFSGNLSPSALSKQISANLEGGARRSTPGAEARGRGPSERDEVGSRSLQAGRIYHEVSGKLACEGLTPEELLGMEQYLHDFQQDMKKLVDGVRAGLRPAPAGPPRPQGERQELAERLDQSYLRLQAFVSGTRDGMPPRAEGGRPGQVGAPRDASPRQARPDPQEQARHFKSLVESSATPAGRSELVARLRDPEATRLLLPTMAAVSSTREGREQVTGFLSNLKQDAAASSALVGALARAGESPEGLAHTGQLLRNVAGDAASRQELAATLVKASETPEGRTALAQSFRSASRSPHGAADLVGVLAGSAGARQGAGPSAPATRPAGAPPAAFGAPALARPAASPPAAFPSPAAPPSAASPHATFGAPALARPAASPPAAFPSPAASQAAASAPATFGAPALARPSGSPPAASSIPPAANPQPLPSTPLLARAAGDSPLAASLTTMLASAAGTYEGRSRVAQLMEGAAQEPSTARSFLASLGKTLETPDGRAAWGTLFEQGKAEVGGGFVRLASAAATDAPGRVDFDGLLRTVASDPATGDALRRQVAEQVRTPEGGAAVLALADRLAGDGDKQRNLVAFLFPPSPVQTSAAGPGPGRDATSEGTDAAALFGKASLSKEAAGSVARLLAGAVQAEDGREVVADVFARLRRNTEARNDFLRAMALGLQDEEGASSLRTLATEMNRTPEARDSVLRTLAQATTGEAGRSAMTGFTEELARRPSTRDAMLRLLDSAVSGEGHGKTVNLLVRNLDQSPQLKETFLGLVREATSTPKGQVELRNLADFLGIPLPKPAPAAPVAGGAVGLSGPGAAKALTERGVASGALFETQRPLAPGRRRATEKVEEVKLEAHKRTAFDARDIFPASAFVSCRRCSNCGFQTKPDATTCPNCSGEGRQAVLRTEIRYNRHGALVPVEDLVEFTPTAFKLLAEGLLGVDRIVFLRFHQVAPKFKELLQVVHIYR